MSAAFSPTNERFRRWGLGLCLGLVALAGATACGTEDGALAGSPGSTDANAKNGTSDSTGSFSFALTLPSGLTFNQFFYTITGPNYSKADSIDVSHSKTVSAVVGDLPVGSGYAVTLAGTSLDPASSCTGSAAFSIAAGVKTSVPVAVSCRLQNVAVAAPVPIPGSTSVALGLVLLGVGAVVLRRRTA